MDSATRDIQKATPTLADGTVRNGWALSSTMGVYGNNFLLRTIVNYGGIWADTKEEAEFSETLSP